MISAISVKDRLKKQAIEEKKTRATTDIDLLAQCITNDIEEMKKVFKEIFSIKCDDALRFDS